MAFPVRRPLSLERVVPMFGRNVETRSKQTNYLIDGRDVLARGLKLLVVALESWSKDRGVCHARLSGLELLHKVIDVLADHTLTTG